MFTRVFTRLVVLLALAFVTTGAAVRALQPRAEPFFAVAANYDFEGVSQPRDAISRELQVIHDIGFNAIRIPVQWRDVEAVRGEYRFEPLDQLFDLAGEAGLRVILELVTSAPPDWLGRQYPDGRFTPESPKSTAGNTVTPCLDHPEIRTATATFIRVISDHLARHRSWYGVDVGSDLPQQRCVCPSSKKRFEAWTKANAGGQAPSNTEPAREAFLAAKLADDVKMLVEATAAPGSRLALGHSPAPSVLRDIDGTIAPQDDWLMKNAVGLYGTSLESFRPPWTGGSLAMAFDQLKSAGREQGWWLIEPPGSIDASDMQLMAWTAVSRGARALSLDPSRDTGALARVISRNPALFAPLQPRPSKVAIVFQQHAREPMRRIYGALFAANIRTDFVHPSELASSAAARYKVLFVADPSALPATARDALTTYTGGGGRVVEATAQGPSAKEIVQRAAAAGVGPEVRLDGGSGFVETRFLESAQVVMLIALNHSGSPERVTMTFTPDTQEAIWMNMVTGSAVNFVAGPDGPIYTYEFRPRDALVLIIRKDIRVP